MDYYIVGTIFSIIWFYVGYKYGRAVEKTKKFPNEKRTIFRKN